MGRRASDKRMEAVDVQSARLQGELSTVIQSAAGFAEGPCREERQLADSMGAIPPKLDDQGVALSLVLLGLSVLLQRARSQLVFGCAGHPSWK